MGEAFDFIAKYGHSPWDSPSWNDDWEREQEQKQREELIGEGYRTIQAWNALGRVVKKGETGVSLHYDRVTLFGEEQTEASPRGSNSIDPTGSLHFRTYVDAIEWAKRNPGRSITRSQDGNGFITT